MCDKKMPPDVHKHQKDDKIVPVDAGSEPPVPAGGAPEIPTQPTPPITAEANSPPLPPQSTRYWRPIRRAVALLAAAGLLSIPVVELISWLKEKSPPLITKIMCQTAKVDGAGQLPALNQDEKVTIAVGENVVCGIDHAGGDFLVWIGGGNGHKMYAGPTVARQEIGITERIRYFLRPPVEPQETACKADHAPLEVNNNEKLPQCRKSIVFKIPGEHKIVVRLSEKGSHYVSEAILPVQVLDQRATLKISELIVDPPSSATKTVRSGAISETLNAPGGLLAIPRYEVRRALAIPIQAGEKIDQSSITVRSSNGASNINTDVTSEGLFVTAHLRSGSGLDKKRAWLNAEVQASISTESRLQPIVLKNLSIPPSTSREIYGQSIPENSTVKLTYDNGQTEILALGSWSAERNGLKVRFVRTETALLSETQVIN